MYGRSKVCSLFQMTVYLIFVKLSDSIPVTDITNELLLLVMLLLLLHKSAMVRCI